MDRCSSCSTTCTGRTPPASRSSRGSGSAPELRVVLLATYRSNWSHGWEGRSAYEQLNLRPLRTEDARLMVAEMAGGGGWPADLADRVLESDLRVALFLETLLHGERAAVAGGPAATAGDDPRDAPRPARRPAGAVAANCSNWLPSWAWVLGRRRCGIVGRWRHRRGGVAPRRLSAPRRSSPQAERTTAGRSDTRSCRSPTAASC